MRRRSARSALFVTQSLDVTGVILKLPSPLALRIKSSPLQASVKNFLWLALNSLALTISISFNFNSHCKDTKRVPYWRTYKHILTRHKKFVHFTLTLHPLHPLKGGMFLSFSLLFPFQFPENQPDKSLISVIDNVCYVYPRARALCEEKGL